MKNTLLGALSALSLMGGAAFAATTDEPGHVSPAPGTSHEAMSAVKDTAAGAVGALSAEMTTSTKGFVQAAAISDMYEVEAGKIAEQRARSSAVKDFAHQMIVAHTGTTEKLKSIIADNSIMVMPPKHLDDRRQGMIDDLRGAKAADFDHRYLAQQEAAHKEARILMRGYAKTGDNIAVRDFAQDTLGTVEEHLAMVQKLEADQKMAQK